MEEEKRLFFGYGVSSPWPSHYPKSDLIDPTMEQDEPEAAFNRRKRGKGVIRWRT